STATGRSSSITLAKAMRRPSRRAFKRSWARIRDRDLPQSQYRVQPTALAIHQGQRPSQRARKLIGDRQAEPGTTAVAIARALHAVKGCLHRRELILRNPRPVVADHDLQ